jgi:dihydrofolate reductase
MKCIVAADKNWGIGLKNALLVHIPNDMKFFRSETMGKVVIMGRKTLESFPQGQPLSGRTNIVLTKDMSYQVKGAVIVHSVEEALAESEKYGQEVYCIGGESIYRQFLPYCTQALVTRIDHAYEADSFFPDLDREPGWKMTKESEEQTYFDVEYTFTTYEKAD